MQLCCFVGLGDVFGGKPLRSIVGRLWKLSVCEPGCSHPPPPTGVTMKLMDEVAGIVAARHCKTNIVTASVDAINFHEKIKKGECCARLGHLCQLQP